VKIKRLFLLMYKHQKTTALKAIAGGRVAVFVRIIVILVCEMFLEP